MIFGVYLIISNEFFDLNVSIWNIMGNCELTLSCIENKTGNNFFDGSFIHRIIALMFRNTFNA